MWVRLFRSLLAVTAVAGAADEAAAQVVCSLFDRHPCAATVCSVLRHRSCIPDIIYPFGQDLRLTIYSTQHEENPQRPDEPRHELMTIRDLFDALRTCWVPPADDVARAGMQMTVRFSFKRDGEVIADPWVTYSTPGAALETRDVYFSAIMASLRRCTPLPFGPGLGGAIAGRPLAVRFVDNRALQGEANDR